MAVVIKKKPQPEVQSTAQPHNVLCEFNPMLAAEGVLGQIKYPIIAMPKHNGVRGENQMGQLRARSLKPIPNDHCRKLFGLPELTNLGGELVVGDPFDEEVFAISTSGVMTKAGEPDVHWYCFDWYHPNLIYLKRLEQRDRIIEAAGHPLVSPIEWKILKSDDELVEESDKQLARGFEGLVLRDPYAEYKTGRSTAKEGGFMRYCPWLRSEAIILAIHEGEINLNPSVKNELGFLKKSSHKENKVGSGQAGSVDCRDINTGIEFSMTVPTDKLQKYMWAHKEEFLNKIVKYKHKPAVIKGGKPRFPIYEGLRHLDDMS